MCINGSIMEKQIDLKSRPGEINQICALRFRRLKQIVDDQLADFALVIAHLFDPIHVGFNVGRRHLAARSSVLRFYKKYPKSISAIIQGFRAVTDFGIQRHARMRVMGIFLVILAGLELTAYDGFVVGR
jgi:hypothetical protein